MDRAECEERIYAKCLDILEIYKEFNPEAGFLNIGIQVDEYISFFNERWPGGKDEKYPLDCHYFLNEEDSDEV